MRPAVALLKAYDYGAWLSRHARGEAAGNLGPYSVDLLERSGLEVRYSDAELGRPWNRSLVERGFGWLGRRRPELLGARNALANRRLLRECEVTLGIFEDQGSFAAFARGWHLRMLAPRRMALVVCWMAERAQHADARTLHAYRRVLAGADLVVFFSHNQAEVFEGLLGVDPGRLLCVPFGIDAGFFAGMAPREDGYLAAIGGDVSRDHELLVEAVRGTSIPTRIYAPTLAATDLPANVQWIPAPVDHVTYRDVLAGASAVVVPATGTLYPGGQTVVLEAMAAGKALITTRTDAMVDYVQDGVNGILVPPGDAPSLRLALERLMADGALRASLGAGGRTAVAARFNQAAMWDAIGARLRELVDETG
jgi:glycosyltransferase involved in cell wall biosynthesis